MRYTLEVSDQDNEFVLEFLRQVTSVKLTPVSQKPKPKDDTEYLLGNPTNAYWILLSGWDVVMKARCTTLLRYEDSLEAA